MPAPLEGIRVVDWTVFQQGPLLKRDLSRLRREKAANPLNNFYRCADGRWLYLGLLDSRRYWEDFCRALGIEELVSDPRFSTPEARSRNNKELIDDVKGGGRCLWNRLRTGWSWSPAAPVGRGEPRRWPSPGRELR